MIINRLREATGNLHKTLEVKLHSEEIMKKILNPQQLAHILATNYAFFKPAEKMLQEEGYPAQEYPLRADYAKADLKKLDAWRDNIDQLQQFQYPDKSESAIMGMLYVMLGSSLGGKLIAEKLERNEIIATGTYTFFETSESAGKYWKNFLQKLEKHENRLDEQKIVESAIRSFTIFHQLCEILADEENIDH
jgi:heme oxygenase